MYRVKTVQRCGTHTSAACVAVVVEKSKFSNLPVKTPNG